MIMVCNGDNLSIVRDGFAYKEKLNIYKARRMIRLLCKAMNWKPIKVVQDDKDGSNCGFYFKLGRHKKIILLEPSEGVVLHELAHHISLNHNHIFKSIQKKLYLVWYGLHMIL